MSILYVLIDVLDNGNGVEIVDWDSQTDFVVFVSAKVISFGGKLKLYNS